MEGIYAEILALRMMVQKVTGQLALTQPDPTAFLDKQLKELLRDVDTYNLEGASDGDALRAKAKAALTDMIGGIKPSR